MARRSRSEVARGRWSTVAWSSVAAFLVAGSAVAFAGGTPGRHPHFDDQGTLRWHTTLSDALADAKAQGKVVLVEYGRLRCTQCRNLVSRVLPDAKVRSRIAAVAVGLACDCDDPEPAVDDMLRRHLGESGTLPFVGILGADGRWITGFSGARSVAEFLGDVETAERAVTAARRAAAPRAAPAPAASRPAPVPAPAPRSAPQGRDAALEAIVIAPDRSAAAAPATPKVAPVAATATVPPPAPAVAASASAPTDPTAIRTRALAAAERSDWEEVLRLVRQGRGDDLVLAQLHARAQAWGEERLAYAVVACRSKRYEEALFAASRVKETLRGEPVAEDAARGLEAIQALRTLARLDPHGSEASALRLESAKRQQGTRWERLFS